MNLNLLIAVPALTLLGILLANGKMARMVALTGAFVQLSAALFMLFSYMDLNDVSHLAFEESHIWFAQWNINYHIGVDAISIAMILLTSIVLVAGGLVSWNIENKPKEFFFLLVMIAPGAFGLFIS